MKLIDKLFNDEKLMKEIWGYLFKGKTVRLVSKTDAPIKAENMKHHSFNADVMYCGLSTLEIGHIVSKANCNTKVSNPDLFIVVKDIKGKWYHGDVTLIPVVKTSIN